MAAYASSGVYRGSILPKLVLSPDEKLVIANKPAPFANEKFLLPTLFSFQRSLEKAENPTAGRGQYV